VALVEGEADTAQALLELPFDHVYFTGSPSIGKKVMAAAAQHLASVTLELGGKSPTIVDATADVRQAARTLAWGKFTNAGQTCIAPDYVLAHDAIHDDLVAALRDQIGAFYGSSVVKQQASPDYARLVHARHTAHVTGLLRDALDAGATLAAGGATDAADRFVAPTVLTGVPLEARIMQEEIFGPLLPVVRYRTLDEALAVVNARPNPLALYVFTESDAVTERVLTETTAGGTCVNEVVVHFLNHHLPFGGSGHSGVGKGHGRHGFEAFSNARAVVRRHAGAGLLAQLYPPYDRLTRTVARWVQRVL
jgi:aldehyde dehydrogenase (NAD+)